MGRFLSALRCLVAASLLTGLLPVASAQGLNGLETTLLQGLSQEEREKALQALRGSRSGSNSDAVAEPGTSQRVKPRNLRVISTAAANGKTAESRRTQEDDEFSPPQSELGDDLPLFGYDLFGEDGNLFAPSTDMPAPAEYTLGPGDVLRVQLFGNQNETLNLSVTRDGAVNFPKLGPIQVAGLKFDDVKTLIERRVAKELIGVQTNITMGPLRSIQVFLLGDVAAPGSYSVSGLATISNALFAGGGVKPSGSLRDIQLKRNGAVIRRLDLYDFLLKGNSSADLRLRAGDVVFVPPAGARVAVAGAVRRPAIYEIRPGISASGVVGMAGGLTADARKAQVLLERLNGDGQRTLQELNLAASGGSMALRDGDRVNVQSVSGLVDNRVAVIGHVRYPALYAWSKGLNLSRVLALAQVKPSSAGRELYPVFGLIERSSEVSGLREWRGFDLMAVRAGKSDVVLQAEDRIAILSRADVDYLTSEPVRAALRGELPAPPKPDMSLRQRNALLASDKSRSEDERSQQAELLEAEELAAATKPAKPVCPGLLEVVKISDSARALAIRLALNAQESTSEIKTRAAEKTKAAQPAESAECPELFRTAPTALVALLEQGVAVIGEARRPGLYPMPAGASFTQLLQAAGGATLEADAKSLDYFTPNDSERGELPQFKSVSMASLAAPHAVRSGEIYQLKPGRALPEVGSVLLTGEVRFPGRYVISRGERIADVLNRAGGLNENAYPYGAVFTRDSTRAAEAASNRRAANDLREALATAVTKGSINQGQNQASAGFLTDLVSRLETAQPVGRIVIEADPSSLLADPSRNLLLEPGDNLVIPKRPSAVTVTGQVLNAGSFSFDPSGSVADYLKQAGGLAEAADDDRMLVILPNGVARPVKSRFWSYEPEPIPPGSVIVVPRDAAPFTALLLTERIASILSNLALSAAALVTINR